MPNDMIVVVKCLQLDENSFKMLQTGAVILATRTRNAMKTIQRILELRLQKFATSVMRDQEILLEKGLRRKLLAVQLRKGEKEVLLQTLERVKTWLKDEESENRPSKKPRHA